MTEQATQTKKIPQKKAAKEKTFSNDAIKALEIEYFKKRRELEREQRIKERTRKAEKVAEAKKVTTQLRKQFGMSDMQIIKQLRLKADGE